VAICKSRKETPGETKPINLSKAFTLDFQPPDCEKTNFCCLSDPGRGTLLFSGWRNFSRFQFEYTLICENFLIFKTKSASSFAVQVFSITRQRSILRLGSVATFRFQIAICCYYFSWFSAVDAWRPAWVRVWPGASLSWSLLKPYCGYNEYLCPWLLLEIEQGFQKVLRFKEKMVYFYLMSTWVFVTSKMLAFLMGSLPDPRTPGTCSQSGLRPAGSATNIS
jgi:hypothetical protein